VGALQTIEIQNFKAFRDFALRLDGRHLLLYGANGSGKSSLYWALHAFLESAGKTHAETQKYFDPNHIESLVNFDADPRDTSSATLKLTVEEGAGVKNTYEVSHTEHQTATHRLFANALLASDFITYRFFFKFSNFTNHEPFEIWNLFEHEILPFCVTTSTANLSVDWQAICNRHEDSVRQKSRGKAASNHRTFLEQHTPIFATNLNDVVESIAKEAKSFYAKHFAKDDAVPLTLVLKLDTKPTYYHAGKRLEIPRILFGLVREGATKQNIERPQTYLNEARLTQIAISIRLAASLVMLQQSPLKLLVLDDLLISLDMSNRMKVLEIILSEPFADYQKIILTHDLGFYEEARRQIGSQHSTWMFQKFEGSANKSFVLKDDKSDLEAAEDFLANDQLQECGNRLRKHAEANLEKFLVQAKMKNGIYPLIEKGDFSALGAKINESINLLKASGPQRFAEFLQREFSMDELKQLLSTAEIDPTQFAALSKDEKSAAMGKLYSARAKLQQDLLGLMTEASRRRVNALKLLEQVESIKDRILNPASHAGVAPIYTKEAEDAIKVIQALEVALTAALATI
jgi:ABC-type Mn2+/Zn2+ transport system ATPase subunit